MAMLRVETEELRTRSIPWYVQRKLRRHKRGGHTGVIMYTILRVPLLNTLSRYWRAVAIVKDGRNICVSGPHSPGSKWVMLAPGRHDLEFAVMSHRDEVVFSRSFELRSGDVIVAGCRSSYSYLPSAKNPPPEKWSIGVF
jgi:hypothetical protein